MGRIVAVVCRLGRRRILPLFASLVYRFDGSFILTHATTQRRWMAPGFGLSANPLEGIGDLWFPIATQWSPGFAIGGLFGQRLMPVAACLIFALEFFLSTLVLARCLGAGFVTGLAGAWLGALFTLPFFVPTLASWRLWGNPHFMTAIAVTSLSLAAFLEIGRQRLAKDIAAGLSILLLLGLSHAQLSCACPGCRSVSCRLRQRRDHHGRCAG